MFRFKTKRLLSRHDKLHLACGNHLLPGWANIDQLDAPGVIKHDLTQPLPAASGTIAFIFTEHFIEHVTRSQGVKLLKECHRLLKPGGVLRISTPDLKKLIAEYANGRIDEWRDMHWLPATPCQLLNEGMRLWGHQFLYDQEELSLVLKESGFTDIRTVDWRKSGHPELHDRECRPYHGEIVVEATR